MEQQGSLSDRRAFLQRAIQGAGLAFAAPAILSSLGSRQLVAQTSGRGALAGAPYGNDDFRAIPGS